MLQAKKPVTSIKKNEVSALQIRRLTRDKTLRTPCVTQHECKHGETNRGKAKKIAPKLFLSHRITWLDKKVLLKCAFLKNLPTKRSSLVNNLKQSGKTAIESHEFSDSDEWLFILATRKCKSKMHN